MAVEECFSGVVGTDLDCFQPVLSLFAKQCARGAFPGGQLVVMRPCFGHAGGFGTVAYADPRRASVVAITTNGHRGVGDLLRRFAPLGSRIRRAVREVS